MSHPDHLLDALSPEQLSEWADYFNEEPFGFPAEDLRAGILAATVARCAGASGAQARDFMLRPPDEEPADPLELVRQALGEGEHQR